MTATMGPVLGVVPTDDSGGRVRLVVSLAGLHADTPYTVTVDDRPVGFFAERAVARAFHRMIADAVGEAVDG